MEVTDHTARKLQEGKKEKKNLWALHLQLITEKFS